MCSTASASEPEFCVFCGERTWGGRRERHKLKSGEGKTVRALTRMLVAVSSRVKSGLNWYLVEQDVS